MIFFIKLIIILKKPNATEIHLDSIEKEEVYNIYCADPIVEDAGTTRYSYSQFCSLWKKAFPRVKIRKFKNVAGKCDPCEQFKYLMKHLEVSKSCSLNLHLKHCFLLVKSQHYLEWYELPMICSS